MDLWKQLPAMATRFVVSRYCSLLILLCVIYIWYFIYDYRTVAYLNKNKYPLRHHWASFSIDRFMHSGHIVTSWVEEAHHKHIKRWFYSERLASRYLRTNFRGNKLNHKNISEAMVKQRRGVYEPFRRDVLKAASKGFTSYSGAPEEAVFLALDRSNIRSCTGYYAKVHGISCAQFICRYIDTKQPI